jgi:hypothetical protein
MRSILRCFSVLLVAFGLAAPPLLTLTVANTGAPEEKFAADEREEQILRKSPSRRGRTRAKTLRHHPAAMPAWTALNFIEARNEPRFYRFLEPPLPLSTLHLFQAFRI